MLTYGDIRMRRSAYSNKKLGRQHAAPTRPSCMKRKIARWAPLIRATGTTVD
jgi:hypothetical protein